MTTRRFAYVAVTSLLVGAQLGVALVNVAMALLVVAWASSWRTQRAPRALWLPVAVLAGLTVAHTVVGTEAQSPETCAGAARAPCWCCSGGLVEHALERCGAQRALVVALAVAAVSMGYALVQVLAQTPGPLRALRTRCGGLRATTAAAEIGSRFRSIRSTRHRAGSPCPEFCPRLVRPRPDRLGARPVCSAPPSALGQPRAGSHLRHGFVGSSRRLSRLCVRCRRPRAVPMGVVVSARGAGLVMMLAVVGGGFGALVSTPDLRERIGSFSGRVPIWAHARDAAAASFPRGMGYGTYPAYAERTYDSVPALAGKVRGWAHNFG